MRTYEGEAYHVVCDKTDEGSLVKSLKRKRDRLVPSVHIDSVIHTIRGERVILDVDLAQLYGVSTKKLNQAVERNANRFPSDFLIQLTRQGWISLRSQIVTSNEGRGGRRYLPSPNTAQPWLPPSSRVSARSK